MARALDKHDLPFAQLGLQFIQLNYDDTAREALQELDVGLHGVYGVRDIVDTLQIALGDLSAERVLEALLDSVQRRAD